jgi:hypothetical protein
MRISNKRTIQVLLGCGCAAALFGAQAQLAGGETTTALGAPADEFARTGKVGNVGEAERIVFEGVKTFRVEEVRRALLARPSFLIASHPQANLEPFLKELQSRVLDGFKGAGFPEARVRVRYDETERRIHVMVEEGIRVFADKVEVLEARDSSARQMQAWFTTSAPKDAQAQKSFAFAQPGTNERSEDGGSVSANLSVTTNRVGALNTPGKADRPLNAMWKLGEPANFSREWQKRVQKQAEGCLADQGFFFARVTAEVRRTQIPSQACLRIVIQDEGPPGIIGRITVSGQKREREEEILRFLHLRPGGRLTAARLTEARRKLWDCGRFWDSDISLEYATAGETIIRREVDLRIMVREQEGGPPLFVPLPPEHDALLRVCRWLEGFPERNEDMRLKVCRLDEPRGIIELLVSPHNGLSVAADLKLKAPVVANLMLGRQSLELCAWNSSNRVELPRDGLAKFSIQLLPSHDNSSTNRFNLAIAGGYSRQSDDPMPPDGSPLVANLTFSRAAFLDLATGKPEAVAVRHGVLLLSNDSAVMRADAKTGRIQSFSRRDAEMSIEWQFGKGLWNKAQADLRRRSSPLPNRYTPGRGLSSFLSLAAGEAAAVYFTETANATNAEPRRLAAQALRRLASSDVLEPLDWIFPDTGTNTFNVPANELDLAIACNNFVTLFAGPAIQWSDKLFPKYSWPWTAVRESAFSMMSQGGYTEQELNRLYGAESTGPIGCLALAEVLAKMGSPAARAFAVQGATRLSARDFLRDCDLLLQGDSGLARSFARFAGALGALPADELIALQKLLPPAEGKLLRDAAAALTANPNGKLNEVLAPALSTYWEQSLRVRVRTELYRVMSHSSEAEAKKA